MPSRIGDEVARPGQRRRQAEHVGEPAHEAVELLGPLDHDADRLLEVVAVARRRARRRRSARSAAASSTRRRCCSPRATSRESASRRRPARTAAVPRSAPRSSRKLRGKPRSTNVPWWHFTRRAPSSPTSARLAGLERGERLAERRIQRVEPAADHRRRRGGRAAARRRG